MNSLGDFPSSGGGIPYQSYSPQFNSTKSYLLSSMSSPSLNTKPKSTISCYPMATAASPASKMIPYAYNGSESPNHSNASSGHLLKETGSQDEMTISEKGFVKNLPQSMLNDQYGIAGMLVGLKATNNKGPISEAMCSEVMTEMSALNHASPTEPFYKRFSGPLELGAEPVSFSPEVGHSVPIYPEYLVTNRMLFESREPDMNYIRKTWALKIEKFGDDLLFYVFYTFTRDILQVVAAGNLFRNGWRFHTELKVWLQRFDNGVYTTENGNSLKEKGIYKYFDYANWKVAQTEMTLDTSKLEGPPQVPAEYFPSTSPKN